MGRALHTCDSHRCGLHQSLFILIWTKVWETAIIADFTLDIKSLNMTGSRKTSINFFNTVVLIHNVNVFDLLTNIWLVKGSKYLTISLTI